MKKIVLTFLALGSLLGASMTAAHAEPNLSRQLTTVSWVIETRTHFSTDGRAVTLIGRVMAREGRRYLFTDGTGFILLNTGNGVLPMGPRLIIAAQIDHAFLGLGKPELEVKNWRFEAIP